MENETEIRISQVVRWETLRLLWTSSMRDDTRIQFRENKCGLYRSHYHALRLNHLYITHLSTRLTAFRFGDSAPCVEVLSVAVGVYFFPLDNVEIVLAHRSGQHYHSIKVDN